MIFQTANYKVEIGASVNADTANDAYQVINKNHGVIEAESFILPQALKYARDLQAALDAEVAISSGV